MKIFSLVFPNTNLRDRSLDSVWFKPDCSHTNAATARTKSGFVNNGQPDNGAPDNSSVEFVQIRSTQNRLKSLRSPPFEMRDESLGLALSPSWITEILQPQSSCFLSVERTRLQNERFHYAASEVQTKGRIRGINSLCSTTTQSERYKQWPNQVYF